MKLRPRREASGSRVRKVLRVPLKTPKENPRRARLNGRSVKSDGLVEKNNVESEPFQDPGPSNLRRSRRIQAQVSRSLVSNWTTLELDRQCFVAVKKLTLAEIEDMKLNLRSTTTKKNKQEKANPHHRRRSVRVAKRQTPLTEETSAATNAMTPSGTPPSPSSSIEIGLVSGIMQLPEEVLDHILGFLPFEEVKSARLVNKHWRQVATTALRRSSKQIKLDDSVFSCVAKMGDGQFPVNKLEVWLRDNHEKTKRCSSYFSGICSWVKELTLNMDMKINIYSKSRIREDMSTFPRDCTYQVLTHFNLRLFERTARTPEFWIGFTDFVQNILKNSPNLREVNVKYSNHNGQKLPICPVIEDLFPDSNSVGCSKLRYINFEKVPLQKIDLAKWSTLNLKLRKLKINLSRSNDLNDMLAKYLETQTGTLRELTLDLDRCDPILPAATFTFLRMEKLEQLGFSSRNASKILVNFPSIDYARLFPCLKKLDVMAYDIDWKDFLGNNRLEPINSMEELIFDGKWLSATPVPVVNAARIFPCLRKLEIPDNRVFTQAVCRNMPNLEVLIINGYVRSMDNLITGLSSAVCETFKGVMTQTWIEKLKTAQEGSMARLQNLKTLKMYNFSGNLICFSRLSFPVLKKMSSLKYLDLFNGYALNTARLEYCSADEKQFLAVLQENFVVL